MHQLRYHSARSASQPSTDGGPAPTRAPRPDRGRRGNARSGAIAPLALAVVALLSGGAFAATRSRPADAPTLAELQAAVHRAVPTSGDFPVGWTADPTDPSDNNSDGDRALAQCLGTTYEDSPTEAKSSHSSAGLSAASDFTIASSVERARADFAALAGPATPGCFDHMMRKALDADKPADGSYDLKVTPGDVAARLPKDTVRDAIGLRVVANFHRGKTTVPLTFETVMIRYDRIQATLTFTAIGTSDFPSDLTHSLTDAVVHRLADDPT